MSQNEKRATPNQDPTIHKDEDKAKIRLKEEQDTLFDGHPPKDGCSALCLSGGGIRSATFSLGVLQGLAKIGWLDKFNYLSTVSGGGYIGGWLSRNIQQHGIGAVVADLTKTERGPNESQYVQSLRAYSNYLSPTVGLSGDALALIGIYFRNLLINWTLLIPLLALLVSVPIGFSLLLDWIAENAAKIPLQTAQYSALTLTAASGVVSVAYCTSDLPFRALHQTCNDYFKLWCWLPTVLFCAFLSIVLWLFIVDRPPHAMASMSLWKAGGVGAAINVAGVMLGLICRSQRALLANTPVWGVLQSAISLCVAAVVGLIGGLVIWCLFLWDYGPIQALVIGNHAELRLTDPAVLRYVTFSVPILITIDALGMSLWALILRRMTDEGAREWWGRAAGYLLIAAIGWLSLCGIVLWLPCLIVLGFYQDKELVLATIGTISGMISSWLGYNSTQGSYAGRDQGKTSLLNTLGIRALDVLSLFFLVSLLASISLTATVIATDLPPLPPLPAPLPSNSPAVIDYAIMGFSSAVTTQNVTWLYELIACLVPVVFFGVAVRFGVNTFSIHSLYCNRLVRAYFGTTRTDRKPHAFTGFDPEDDVPLSTLTAQTPLYPVINTAINFSNAVEGINQVELQERRAGSFIFTPNFSGCAQTGYVETAGFAGGVPFLQSMVGLEEPPGISLGRAIAISGAAASPNMGYHTSPLVAFVMTFFNIRLGWWVPNPKQTTERELRRSEPLHPIQSMLCELLGSTSTEEADIYLSDGGHFDNLGLYEMVRRRCTRIVVVDASCDPESEFDDLERTLNLIKAEFGVTIRFDDGLPTPTSIREIKQHHGVGTIEYPARNGEPAATGCLLYIKPGLSGTEPLPLTFFAQRCHKRKQPFPHDPTSDQFFSSQQFESYRELGLHSVMQANWPAWNTFFTSPAAPSHATVANYALLQGVLAASPYLQPASQPDGVWANITEATGAAFTRDTAPLWAALFAAPIIGTTVTPTTSDTRQTSEILIIDTIADGTPQPAAERDSDPRIMLPIFAEGSMCTSERQNNNAACRYGLAIGAEEPRSGANNTTTGLGSLFDQLARILVHDCMTADTPLKLMVRGYASSSEFKINNQQSNNDALLRALAAGRADFVSDELNKSVKEELNKTAVAGTVVGGMRQSIMIEPIHNPNPADKRYVDRFVGENTGYSRAAGSLNRRVDIELDQPGKCNVGAIWKGLGEGQKSNSV